VLVAEVVVAGVVGARVILIELAEMILVKFVMSLAVMVAVVCVLPA